MRNTMDTAARWLLRLTETTESTFIKDNKPELLRLSSKLNQIDIDRKKAKDTDNENSRDD